MYHEPVPCFREHIPDDRFFVECVIVCHRFADFLAYTLPHNKQFFDRVVVVTSPEDKETQKLCEFHHVECVRTTKMRTAEGKFCKGAGINEGLEKLSKRGWVVHMDADIWLPPQTRLLLAWANLDKRMVYGIDRFAVTSPKAWHEFLAKPRLQHECGAYIHLKSGFNVSTRVMQRHMGGYLPIGFFQMWNPRCSGVFSYPEGHTDAGREDLLFASRWARSQRSFIPEIVGYHLESPNAPMGANWSGRRTPPFVYALPQPWYVRLWSFLRNT